MTGYRRNARDQQNVHLTPLPASFPHPPTAICALAKERGNGSCMLDIPAESLANPPRRGEYRNAHTALPLRPGSVSYTHLRAHETDSYLVCRLLLEKKKKKKKKK